MIIGYARVSTDGQTLDAQQAALKRRVDRDRQRLAGLLLHQMYDAIADILTPHPNDIATRWSV